MSSQSVPKKSQFSSSLHEAFQFSQAVETTKDAYEKMIAKVKDPEDYIPGLQGSNQKGEPHNSTSFNISNPNMIRGGLIGVAISALISWNAGKYSRLGIIRKRWQFIRSFIMVNRKPEMSQVFTNYYSPPLDSVVKNFMCYSGQAGIGKSTHFMHLAYTQSGIRPALYLSFKASGKDATFEEDMAQQAEYGSDCPGILSEVIKATKRIDYINKFPQRFWLKIVLSHLLFGIGAYSVAISSIEAVYGIVLFSTLSLTYLYHLYFIYPLLIQSFRRTCPVIIFDDINKIEHINMLPEIVRYLQLLEHNIANVILVSPDEDTWCKLRREPGVKDRLRVRQIYYNHLYTAQALLKYISTQENFSTYMKYVHGNPLYSRQIVVSLIKELIGKRQVTLRRFSSILVLNDEQQYEKLVEVLAECAEGKISKGEAVQKFTDILYDSQARTMVANLKNIKRQVKIPEEQFLGQLKMLLKKRKLPSDNQIAPHLKAYNIVRDLQSEYVFNGRFMFTVFNMAIQGYEKDMKEFKTMGTEKEPVILQKPVPNAPDIPRPEDILEKATGRKEEVIKNWNKSNISVPNPPIEEVTKPEDQKKKKEGIGQKGQKSGN